MSFADRMRDAQNSFAPAAKFKKDGDMVIGVVRGFNTVTGDYGKQTVVTIEQEDGEAVSVYVSNTVLANQMKEQDPKIGETIGVKYLGKVKSAAGREYKNWVVMVDRPEAEDGGSFNAHAGDDSALYDHDPEGDPNPTFPQTDAELAKSAAKAKEEAIADADDDLPF